MRAKTINEVNKFERGMSPKAAMDIGGVNFGEEFQEEFEQIAFKWFRKLKGLEGKTITTKALKFYKANNIQITDWEEHTIKVENVLEPSLRVNISSKGDVSIVVNLWVIDENFRYDLGDLNKKIYIE